MTKRYENALLAAHLSKTQGVMPDFGCRQHQEMGRQSSPAGSDLVQTQESRTWKREVSISSLSSVLSSSGRQLTFSGSSLLGDHGLSCKTPEECPKWTSGSCQDTPLRRLTPLQGWGLFLFPDPPRKLFQDLLAQPGKGLSQLSGIF